MRTTPDAHNPYLAARYVHNERYCSLTKSIRNWQLVGGGLLIANIGLASGLVYVTGKQQIAPYIVEVDAAGSAVAIRELRAETVQDPLVIAAVLRRFLADIRTLSTDAELRARQMNTAYRMCLVPAQNYLTAYYTENKIDDLLRRGRTFPLSISLTPVSANGWRARWKEQTLAEDGSVRAEQEWEATIEIALVLPRSKDERQFSPLGVWIAHLQWSEV
jgi:type IV secretion system protein VirB5